METACLVYITTASTDEAVKISHLLIEKKLAACTNIIPTMTSVYRWKGKVCQESETVLIAKTRKSLVNDLTEAVKSIHSYETPCVVAVPIAEGSPEYLKWIFEETAP